MKLYIAGPMRGYPEANFPAFDRTRDLLKASGHEPISPADHDRELGLSADDASTWTGDFQSEHTFHQLMRWDLMQVMEADGIALLPGWEDSVGANHERNVAEACGKRIYLVDGVQLSDYWQPTRLVEDLPPEPATIVGLSGYAQAGKDTAGGVLVEKFGFERIGFADALRDMLYALDPPVRFNAFKPVNLQKWTVRGVVGDMGWEWAKAHTDVRELLQRLGTEAGRDVLGDDVWVRTAMAKVKPGGRYVFTDVRFPNEAAAIKDAGGQVWRINRKSISPANAHPSETALDDYAFDVFFSVAEATDLSVLRRWYQNEMATWLEAVGS